MKKRKTYEVSVVNKTSSRLLSDQTKFYTSDTALELVFKLKEVEYDFDSAELILLNDEDRSVTTRPVKKTAEGFTYDLEDDIIEHYGTWSGQLKFTEDGEYYISSPIGFRIHNDLYNDRPPRMSDVNTWKNLRKIADGLISDIRSELELFEEKKLEIETSESERQSAELLRIENENQRNLTSVEEFTKLQDAIGGRNLVPDSDFTTGRGGWVGYYGSASIVDGEVLRFTANGDGGSVTRMEYPFTMTKSGIYTLTMNVKATVPIYFRNFVGTTISNGDVTDTGNVWTTISTKFTVDNDNTSIRFRLYLQNPVTGSNIDVDWFKVEKGEESTPYTKAPEDYTTVSKEDYYNHVKLMSEQIRSDVLGKADKKQEDWITATLLNGATGEAKYRKNEFGRVEFTGYITMPTSHTSNYVMSIASEHRPKVDTYLQAGIDDFGGGGVLFFRPFESGNSVWATKVWAGRTAYLDGLGYFN